MWLDTSSFWKSWFCYCKGQRWYYDAPALFWVPESLGFALICLTWSYGLRSRILRLITFWNPAAQFSPQTYPFQGWRKHSPEPKTSLVNSLDFLIITLFPWSSKWWSWWSCWGWGRSAGWRWEWTSSWGVREACLASSKGWFVRWCLTMGIFLNSLKTLVAFIPGRMRGISAESDKPWRWWR